MKKSEIIEVLAEKTGLSKADVTKVYEETFELFKEELGKGNDVSVAGFGSFKISKRAARDGINPLTKEPLHIDAKNADNFFVSTFILQLHNNTVCFYYGII